MKNAYPDVLKKVKFYFKKILRKNLQNDVLLQNVLSLNLLRLEYIAKKSLETNQLEWKGLLMLSRTLQDLSRCSRNTAETEDAYWVGGVEKLWVHNSKAETRDHAGPPVALCGEGHVAMRMLWW